MFIRLLLLFTVLPFLELVILLKIGASIGLFETIFLVVCTALVGAFFAKKEGINTLWRIRQQLAMGVLPTIELIDGVLILAAALLLITPGFITDTLGFCLLIPFTRRYIREIVKQWMSNWINRRRLV
jgi:UPF0716 protein FxsA